MERSQQHAPTGKKDVGGSPGRYTADSQSVLWQIWFDCLRSDQIPRCWQRIIAGMSTNANIQTISYTGKSSIITDKGN